MKPAFTQNQFKKRQFRQSALTLLVFFVTFFAHSEHFAQAELDKYSAFELHDCHLCQQGLDSPPAPIQLKPVKNIVFSNDTLLLSSVILVTVSYVYPLLRAPPVSQ